MDKIQLKDLDISLVDNKRNYISGDTVYGTVYVITREAILMATKRHTFTLTIEFPINVCIKGEVGIIDTLGIAPSYESDHGLIEYYLKVTIDETTVDEVQTVKTGITVSVGGNVDKVFTFPTVGTGSIRMHASVVRKGFESGHPLEVDCFIWNESSLDVKPRVTLYQTKVYICGERHKAVDVALTEALVGQVVKGSAKL
ncbi:unnamed protein product [Oppiella nova]|uniref:Uncharacterized protein n=1 Tax=Oppiella nova TaxID=334625 RepID=A0A7R9LS92_9ACAR|nr:unnamed protein product [Oppiella nova]CAG2166465.1 unnamed protein product [Oppiella nova]